MAISDFLSNLTGLKWSGSSSMNLPKASNKNARMNIGGDGFMSTPMMKSWTASRLDQVKAYKHWVYVAINRIAEKVASQYPNIGTITSVAEVKDKEFQKNGFETKAYKAAQFKSQVFRSKALTPLYGQETIEHVKYNHPIRNLLSDPNEPDTSYDLWYETVMFLLLTGSAYWWVPKNKFGVPAAIWVIPSHWVWPIAGKDRQIEYYEVRPVEGNYLRRAFPPDEIIKFVKKSPISKIDGYAPTVAGDNWIDSASSIDRSRNFNFKNGAFPSVALEFLPEYNDPQEEDLKRIEAKFMARYAGVNNNGKPLLLPPGVKFHNIAVTPREMDYTESAEQMRDNVLALFGVPPIIAGIASATGGQDTAAANSIFCSITVNPLCRFLGQVLTEKLAKPIDETLRIWWDDATPDDPTNVEKKLETDMKLGAVTPNEIRIMRGREPYDFGGDNPILPNMGIVLPYGNGIEENYLEPTEVRENINEDKKPKKSEEKE